MEDGEEDTGVGKHQPGKRFTIWEGQMTARIGLLELVDSLNAEFLIMETEGRAAWQRELDGQGADEGCGLCGNGVICFWHHGARAEWPRRMAG